MIIPCVLLSLFIVVYIVLMGMCCRSKNKGNIVGPKLDTKSDFTLNDDVFRKIGTLSATFEDYLFDQCQDRAQLFHRNFMDITDFEGVIYALGQNNPLINKLMEDMNSDR